MHARAEDEEKAEEAAMQGELLMEGQTDDQIRE